MSCAVCGRQPRGFGFTSRTWDTTESHEACSMECLNIIARGNGEVIKLPHYETIAIEEAGAAGGTYLEQIGKTDLAQLSGDEWTHFVALIFVSATDKVRRLVAEKAVPF